MLLLILITNLVAPKSKLTGNITSTTLNLGYGQAVGYDCSSKRVQIVGGSTNILRTFDPETKQFDSFYHQSVESVGLMYGQAWTQVNNFLFFIFDPPVTHQENLLSVFNLETRDTRINYLAIPYSSYTNNSVQYQCLTHFDHYFIITGGSSSRVQITNGVYNSDQHAWHNNILIYNILTDTWLDLVMSETRSRHTCIVNHNNKYLYNIGGDWLDSVEKLYIGNMSNIHNEKSILLQDKLFINEYAKDDRNYARSFMWGNNIYVVAGGPLLGYEQRSILVINTLDDSITISNHFIQRGITSPGAIFIGNTFYLFGGKYEYCEDPNNYWFDIIPDAWECDDKHDILSAWQYIHVITNDSIDFCNFSAQHWIEFPDDPFAVHNYNIDSSYKTRVLFALLFILFMFCVV